MVPRLVPIEHWFDTIWGSILCWFEVYQNRERKGEREERERERESGRRGRERGGRLNIDYPSGGYSRSLPCCPPFVVGLPSCPLPPCTYSSGPQLAHLASVTWHLTLENEEEIEKRRSSDKEVESRGLIPNLNHGRER